VTNQKGRNSKPKSAQTPLKTPDVTKYASYFFGVPRRQTQFNKAQQHDSWGQVVEAASQNSTEISLDVSLMTRWLPCLGGTGGLPIHGCTDSSQAGWVLVRFWDAKLGMAK